MLWGECWLCRDWQVVPHNVALHQPDPLDPLLLLQPGHQLLGRALEGSGLEHLALPLLLGGLPPHAGRGAWRDQLGDGDGGREGAGHHRGLAVARGTRYGGRARVIALDRAGKGTVQNWHNLLPGNRCDQRKGERMSPPS